MALRARRCWTPGQSSTCTHGGASLQAYARQLGGDTQALIDATIDAAADLGWGRWTVQTVQSDPGGPQLQVSNSPFVDGWRAAAKQSAAQPVCAPVRGMFTALIRCAAAGRRPGRRDPLRGHASPAKGGVCTFRIRQEAP